MARILVNALAMGTAGGRTYAYNLLKSFAQSPRAHEYDVLLRRDQVARFSGLASDRVTILPDSYKVPERLWGRMLWEQLVLPFIVRRHDADVLVSMGSVDAFLASVLTPVRSVVVVQLNQPWMVPHVLPSKLRVAFINAGVKLSVRTADHFVVMSETAKRELCRIFGVEPSRVSVVYHGVAHELFSPKARAGQAVLHRYGIVKPYILSVSSISTFKNYHRLVEAYAIVRTKRSNAPRLVLAGQVKHKSYYAELEKLIGSLGLQESVQLLGRVPHEDLPAIYSNAELYVFPSLCETFGLTQLEAMACGTPVIASNVSVMPEICGDAAEYFDPYVPAEIAEAVAGLISDDERRRQLVARGFHRVQAFSWQRTAQQTLDLLEKIVHAG